MAEKENRPIAAGVDRRLFALSAAVMLVGMALLGMMAFMPVTTADPGPPISDVVENDDLITGATATPDILLRGSTDTSVITYTIMTLDIGYQFIQNVSVTIWDGVDGGVEIELYSWNATLDDNDTATIDYSIDFEYDGTYMGDTMQVNISADYFDNRTYEKIWDTDSMMIMFVDGPGWVKDLDAHPDTVPGTGMTNISWNISRDYDDIDDVWFGIYDNNAMMWVIHNDAMLNHMNGSGYVWYWYHFNIPEYHASTHNVNVTVLDSWGYTEIINETLITVQEMAPVNVSDLMHFEFPEDDMIPVDLSDLFYDANGDDLKFYIDTTDTGNLVIEWGSLSDIDVSALEDWNGEEDLEVFVNDTNGGKHNVSFMLHFTITAVDDELAPAPMVDRTVMVDEVEMYKHFNPLVFFEDVDGPEFIVSLGWEWNETNKTPIWSFMDDENMTHVEIDNETLMGNASLLMDMENGTFEFPITAWVDGEPVLNSSAWVKVDEVNDLPVGPVDIKMERNSTFVADLRDHYTDADNMTEDLNFTLEDYDNETLVVSYDPMNYTLTIDPIDADFTGQGWVKINVTDGMDYYIDHIPVFVDPLMFTLTINIQFENWTANTAGYNLSHEQQIVDVTVGSEMYDDNATGQIVLTLKEGTYQFMVGFNLPANLTYVLNETSGYMVPTYDDIVMDMDMTIDVFFAWMKVEEEPQPVDNDAEWGDIKFSEAFFEKDGDDVTVIVPVDPAKENYTKLKIYLVIKNSDDANDTVEFLLPFVDGNFTLKLSDVDAWDDVKDGKKEYYFKDNGTNSYTPTDNEFEFRKEDVKDGFITVIVLIILIVLVLIALVFIMRKPAEEEYEDEVEEEETTEKVCPSCGEIVEDPDAEVCPECGEDLVEEE